MVLSWDKKRVSGQSLGMAEHHMFWCFSVQQYRVCDRAASRWWRYTHIRETIQYSVYLRIYQYPSLICRSFTTQASPYPTFHNARDPRPAPRAAHHVFGLGCSEAANASLPQVCTRASERV